MKAQDSFALTLSAGKIIPPRTPNGKGADAMYLKLNATAGCLSLLLLGLTLTPRYAAAAETPVALRSAASFGVLAGATVTSTGATVVNGDVGLSPGVAVVLAAPGIVTGTVHVNDPIAQAAQGDLAIAYADAAGRSASPVILVGNIGGLTLGPGLYRSTSSLAISAGDLTLDGQGNPNAVFIFQIGSTLTTTVGRQVLLIGGAQAGNVFWQVGSSATIGTGSAMVGNILAAQSITIQAGATLRGRALARSAAVTLDANVVSLPGTEAGTVVAWGRNTSGQNNVPPALRGVIAIAAGEDYFAALKSDGRVVAWGLNTSGQTNVPAGLSNVTAIASGQAHNVALRSDGTVAAWGNNANGQTTVPPFLGGVTAIAAGQGDTVVLKNDGTVVAWGLNTFGQTDVPSGLTGVTAIAAGDGHTVALKSDGTVVAWGANSSLFGFQSTVPVGLSGVVAIAAGSSHTLALKSNGKVVAWGNDLSGQSTVPAGLSGVIAIAAGDLHSVALKSDGTVVAWGLNDDGQATAPPSLGGVTALAAGRYNTAALIGPIITTQPQGQTFTVGTDFNLNVSAIGSGLTYQWLLNGTNIAGATNPILQFINPAAAAAGTYRVIVTSVAGGAVTSPDAVLLALSFLDLKFYAGITLTGTVGNKFRVDYADAVVSGPTNWLTLTTLTLPSSPYLVIDPNSSTRAKRFYRVVLLP